MVIKTVVKSIRDHFVLVTDVAYYVYGTGAANEHLYYT